MLRFDPSHQLLAVGVAILAGFVDAIGFVESAGFFVSFMTGNSTRLAVGLAEGQHAALVAAIIIATFVFGVVAGSLVGAQAGRRRSLAVLIGVTILLAIATLLRLEGEGWSAILSLALAMGVANAAVAGRDGSVIEGLYAVGNDRASIMGGNYPGAGITHGPNMTFGYVTGLHIAEKSRRTSA